MIGYSNILEDEFIKEAVGDYKLVPSKFGFVHSRADDFTDDGNFFTCYRYKGDGNRLSIWTQGLQGGRSTRASENEEFISLNVYEDRDLLTDEEYRAADNYNGISGFKDQAEADAALQELANIAEKIYRAKHEDQYKDRKEAEEGKYVVEIVQGSGKLRAVADDGEHGKAFVMFPNALRNRVGQRYQVDGLRWNGKNYSVIGKPQIIESEQICSKRKIKEDESFVDYAVDLIEDYCYMEKDLETTTRQEIEDFIYNDICDDDLSDYKPSKEDIDAIIDRLIKSGYKVTEDEVVDEVQEIAEPLIGELILKAIPSYISDKVGWRLDWGNPTPEDFYVHISVPNNDEDELKDIAFYSKDYKFDGYKTEVNQFDDNVEIHFIKEYPRQLEDEKITEARTATQLREELAKFGETGDGMSQKQMEQRLYELYWAQNHPDNPEPPKQFDPMLAKDSTRMSQEEVDSKYSSKTHVIQQKYDGLRCILTLQPGKEPTINTRGRSVKDFAFPDHTGKILGLQGAKVPFKGITVLDGEALAPTPEMTNPRTGVTTKSSLGAINMIFKSVPESKMLQEKYGSATYVAYDILYYDGEDVQDMPYDDREKLIPLAVKQLQEANGNKLPISAAPTYRDYESAYKIFQEHIAKGDEGVMIKDKNLKYTQGARSSGMQKLKGYETIDAFITGSIPSSEGTKYEDLIGGFEFSAYVDGKPRVIAHLSGLTDELRKDATVPGSNPPQLNPDYLNRCAQLRGQEFGKNSLLGSARIDEWRPDKTPEQCQLTAEDIKPKGR